MRWKLVICLLLSVTTAAVYWPVRHYAFIYYDDPQFITENKAVIAGLTVEGFRHAFTRPVVGNWHPVTTLSQMLDCELYGVRPGGHHLTNVALHAANAILLFLLLTQMTGAMWRSAAVAALFALHPLRVESVAWISERKDVLCAFFGLLSLFAYARFAQSQNTKCKAKESVVWRRAPAFRIGVDEQDHVGDLALCHAFAGCLAIAETGRLTGGERQEKSGGNW